MAVAAIVFLAVSIGLLVGFLELPGRLSQKRLNLRHRFDEEFGKSRVPDAPLEVFKGLEKVSLLDPGDSASKEKVAQSARWSRHGLCQGLERLLEQAQVALSVRQLALIVIGLGLGFGMLAALLGGFVIGLATCVVSAAGPVVMLQLKRKALREKYLQQLPKAFDLMARLLRGGQSVSQALQAVADTFEDPIASAFAQCQHQQGMGLPPDVTYEQLAQGSGAVELRIFVIAMLIQRQVGGNLSEVLERLAALLRARLQLRQQIQTLTAEGRLQAWTLFALPILMFGVMMVINRRYADVLLEHRSLIAATLASMTFGMLWIRRLVRVEA
jgi:tight adherence protein B